MIERVPSSLNEEYASVLFFLNNFEKMFQIGINVEDDKNNSSSFDKFVKRSTLKMRQTLPKNVNSVVKC